MLQKQVLPPAGGISSAYSMLAFGGSLEIRHVGVPHRLARAEAADRLRRSRSRWRPRRFPGARRRSGARSPGSAPSRDSPNRRLNAISSSSLSVWSRNSSTKWSRQACMMRANATSSRSLRSTPFTVAPSAAPVGTTWVGPPLTPPVTSVSVLKAIGSLRRTARASLPNLRTRIAEQMPTSPASDLPNQSFFLVFMRAAKKPATLTQSCVDRRDEASCPHQLAKSAPCLSWVDAVEKGLEEPANRDSGG